MHSDICTPSSRVFREPRCVIAFDVGYGGSSSGDIRRLSGSTGSRFVVRKPCDGGPIL